MEAGPRRDRMRRRATAVAGAALSLLAGSAWALPAPVAHFAAPARTPVTMTLTGLLTVGGAAAGPGAEVAVRDPQGVLCGASGVDPANGGAFVLHVYGDDPTTAADEGAREGDGLQLEVHLPGAAGTVGLGTAPFGTAPPAGLVFAGREAFSLRVMVTPVGPPPLPDRDGDGVADAEDAFPTDPAASVDSDGDGYPDAWNPGMGPLDSTTGLVLDDVPADPEQWPTRHRPARPELSAIAPAPGGPPTLYAVTLTPMEDPEEPGGSPSAVEWSLHSGDLTFEVARIVHETPGLPERLEVPVALLTGGAPYAAQVRYRDGTDLWSEASDPRAFAAAADPGDADGDGFQDAAQVAGGLGGPWSFREAESGRRVGLTPTEGRLEALATLRKADLPDGRRPPGEMPYGLVGFRVGGVQPAGSEVSVALEFPERLPPGTRWYKVRADGSVEDYTDRVTFDGPRAVLRLADGGRGDADGIDNATVVDPGGPAVPETAGTTSGGGGGGGGCFLEVLTE